MVARPEADPESVDVVEVDGLELGTAYRVDPSTKKVLTVGKGEAPGTGAVSAQLGDATPRLAKTKVVRVDAEHLR